MAAQDCTISLNATCRTVNITTITRPDSAREPIIGATVAVTQGNNTVINLTDDSYSIVVESAAPIKSIFGALQKRQAEQTSSLIG